MWLTSRVTYRQLTSLPVRYVVEERDHRRDVGGDEAIATGRVVVVDEWARVLDAEADELADVEGEHPPINDDSRVKKPSPA